MELRIGDLEMSVIMEGGEKHLIIRKKPGSIDLTEEDIHHLELVLREAKRKLKLK